MKQAKGFMVAIGMAVVFSIATGAGSALALEPGDQVIFRLPAAGIQPEPPTFTADKIIYTGGKMMTIDTAGCVPGEHPMQNGVLVDPGGVYPSGTVVIITISQFEPVPPGTRLDSLTGAGSCFIGGTEYNRYQGTVK